MKPLLIGATSYIGSRLYFDLHNKFDLLGTYYKNNTLSPRFIQLDVKNPDALDVLLSKENHDVVIHLANYSSPSQIKGNEVDFPKLNLEATKSVVNAVNKYSKKLIFFSSMAATTKQDLYGNLKAQSEELVKTVKYGYFILRPSAVIGLSPVQTHGKITDKILAVIHGGAAQFDNSWVLQPTYIGHLSQAIEQIITKNIWNEEVNVFTDYQVTKYGIASDILKGFGLKAVPLDTGRVVPLAKVDKEKTNLFSFSPSTYPEIIDQIVLELKNPEKLAL